MKCSPILTSVILMLALFSSSSAVEVKPIKQRETSKRDEAKPAPRFRFNAFHSVGSFGPLGAKIRAYRGSWGKQGKGDWRGGWEKANEFEGKLNELKNFL